MYKILHITEASQILITAALAADIWNEYFPAIIGQDQVDYMVEKFQTSSAITNQIKEGMEYYLLSFEDTLVGYTGLIPSDPDRDLMISKLYLKRSTRGMGLGKILLEFAIDMALQKGYDKVWLTVNRENIGTVSWYQRRGFVITKEIDKDIGNGFVMNDYVMELFVG